MEKGNQGEKGNHKGKCRPKFNLAENGWGGRTRTYEWQNQNLLVNMDIVHQNIEFQIVSKDILKLKRDYSLFVIGKTCIEFVRFVVS